MRPRSPRSGRAPDGALLGRDFVEKYKDKYPWKIGQTYKLRELGDMSIHFVGTYTSSNEVYNTLILAGRRYLQEVDGKLGVAHQVFVKIDDPAEAGEVIAQIDETVPRQFPLRHHDEGPARVPLGGRDGPPPDDELLPRDPPDHPSA